MGGAAAQRWWQRPSGLDRIISKGTNNHDRDPSLSQAGFSISSSDCLHRFAIGVQIKLITLARTVKRVIKVLGNSLMGPSSTVRGSVVAKSLAIIRFAGSVRSD
jgi:hypothetical protein